MTLKDLNSDLYDPHSDIDTRHHETSRFDPMSVSSEETGGLDKQSQWKEKEKKTLQAKMRKGKIIRIFLLVALVIAVSVSLFFVVFKSRKSAFYEERVVGAITGPSEIESSQDATFNLLIKNNNRIDLDSVKVELRYPSNFQPEESQNIEIIGSEASMISVGVMGKNTNTTVTIKGKFFAPKGSTVYIRATILYKPAGMSIEFKNEQRYAIKVRTAPVGIEVVGPYEASDGSDVFYTVVYENFGDQSFKRVVVKAEYPDSFSFKESDLQPVSGSDKSWNIGTLEAHQKKEIKIRGTLRGERDTFKLFIFHVGIESDDGSFVEYGTGEKTTKLIQSPLSVELTLSGSKGIVPVTIDEAMRYTVDFRNDGNVGVRDAIITANFSGELIDIEKSILQGGYYETATNTITWKAESVPALAILNPGDKGGFSFSLSTKSKADVIKKINLSHEKNFNTNISVKIDSPDIPIPVEENRAVSSNVIEVRFEGDMEFLEKGYYFDNTFPNTGPAELKIGEETTFTIHWIISSSITDLTEARVEASLPAGIQWKGVVSSQDEDISFNPRTNFITWNVGDVAAGSGFYLPSREIVFRVGLVPSIENIGSYIELVNKGIITAKDEFTGASYQIRSIGETTQLRNDTQWNAKK